MRTVRQIWTKRRGTQGFTRPRTIRMRGTDTRTDLRRLDVDREAEPRREVLAHVRTQR